MSNFAQTTSAKKCKRGCRGTESAGIGNRSVLGIAKEAMLLACDAKTGRDKQEFLELARVDPDRLATAVSRDQLKRRSLGQAHRLFF